jgi:hypothetical protein
MMINFIESAAFCGLDEDAGCNGSSVMKQISASQQ